jgi:hypothetical protein
MDTNIFHLTSAKTEYGVSDTPPAAPFSTRASHKTADNDNECPPALPVRMAVPMPVPGFEPIYENL